MNERIKEVRKTLNLTMKKFGEQIGISEGAVSNIEKGHRNVTNQMIKAICREFNVNQEWLCTGIGEMFSDTPASVLDQLCFTYNLDDIDRKIIDMYITLPASVRDVLKSQIQSIASNNRKE